ncbi:EAL domain-containing protein [Chitinibacter fontanus]|uniref:EAL domain-containing protein n=1 Tax=Chitinibacter fontanus TaxID=1737446 RepID=A0A7D5ZFD3_9NEIS|nr:bifunctional diguanylate cyclase/phosphodiesterase [Chitinibacter fontanus]QLI81468.1 EAL domain-containing protein [Chitinibacter fontanus]
MSQNELEPAIRILGDINASLIALDLEGYITGWNGGAERLFGYPSEEVLGRHVLMLYADETDNDIELFNRVLTQGQTTLEVKRRHKDGRDFWVQIHLNLVRDEAGKPLRMIGFLHDISSQIADQVRSRLLASVFRHTPDAIVITDESRHLIECNPAYLRLIGDKLPKIIGKVPYFLEQEVGKKTATAQSIDAHLASTGHWEGELWSRRANGEAFPAWLTLSAVHGRQNKLQHYFAVMADLSERKAAEEQIFRLAYFDTLTKLPNRSHLFSLLEQALSEARRQQRSGALLCFNIAGFKAMNDSFTHRGGDQILVVVAERIRSCLRDEDVLSRFGGDEFCIGLFDIRQREDAAIVAERILATVAEPYYVQQEEIVIKAHIGMSVFPDDGRDADKLINLAAVAMHRAKQGRQAMLFYSSDMNQRSLARIKLTTDLHHALARDEFELHYQPQVNAQTGQICGAEALIRWRHPQRGLVPPGEFIPFAEESGLIVQIGIWVFNAACQQMAQWRHQGLGLERLAINLSPRQFGRHLVDELLAVVNQHQLPASCIELEITETLLMKADEDVTATLNALHQAGFSLALDDFGTGYSNLGYLHAFPLDYLKIDQSFVRGLPDNHSNAAIVRAIIGIALNLELQLIAEGVENEAEAQFLASLDCHQLQGYYLAKPMPAADFVNLLQPSERSLLGY